jgi:hypothetical protein
MIEPRLSLHIQVSLPEAQPSQVTLRDTTTYLGGPTVSADGREEQGAATWASRAESLLPGARSKWGIGPGVAVVERLSRHVERAALLHAVEASAHESLGQEQLQLEESKRRRQAVIGGVRARYRSIFAF